MTHLNAFFHPKSVAVIGATETEGSVGKTVISNLLGSNFSGKVFPVHPKRETVLGEPCFKKVTDIQEEVDLAIIIVPAQFVPGVIEECSAKKVKGAIIISAGFKELGEPGIALEKQIMDIASKTGLRIVGPNCLGIMNPHLDLNATFSSTMAKPGNIAFISQSGALCTAVLDWSFTLDMGFSAFVSIGSMLDVDWGDLIEHLNEDPNTSSIFIYMETIGNAKNFLKAAKATSLKKPIIVIKGGRSNEAAAAAASHTGSLAGSDAVVSAALEQVGVIQVDSIKELFNLATFLSTQPIPQGDQLTIITNAGGPGVLAVDALVGHQGKLHHLEEGVIKELNGILPEAWSHSNPIDVLGDADAIKYERTLQVCQNDEGSDATLVILTPQDMTEPVKTAEFVVKKTKKSKKPVLTSWMGGGVVEAGKDLLQKEGIANYDFPDEACRVFGRLCQYHKNQTLIQSSFTQPNFNQLSRKKMQEILDVANQENREILTEFESKAFLGFAGLPVLPTKIAATKEQAVQEAKEMSFPIVLKLHSETITHKSDVGGVKLNLKSIEDVERAFDEIEESVSNLKGKEHFQGVSVQPMAKLEGYEVILGSSFDEQMGPVVLFGTGGKLVEVYQDSSIFLPPLTPEFAHKMMEKTKIFEALQGVRGEKGVDIDQLQNLLVLFSHLLVEFPQIKECDINPLLVSSDQIVALDARIVLHQEGQSSSRTLPL